jgi:hypothetical protein
MLYKQFSKFSLFHIYKHNTCIFKVMGPPKSFGLWGEVKNLMFLYVWRVGMYLNPKSLSKDYLLLFICVWMYLNPAISRNKHIYQA